MVIVDSLSRSTDPVLAGHLDEHAAQTLGEISRAWLLCLFAHPAIAHEVRSGRVFFEKKRIRAARRAVDLHSLTQWRLWLWDVMSCAAAEVTDGEQAACAALSCACCVVVALASALQPQLLATADDAELHHTLTTLWDACSAADVNGAIGDAARAVHAHLLSRQCSGVSDTWRATVRRPASEFVAGGARLGLGAWEPDSAIGYAPVRP